LLKRSMWNRWASASLVAASVAMIRSRSCPDGEGCLRATWTGRRMYTSTGRRLLLTGFSDGCVTG
jgi:hypothetical protein